MSDAVHQTSSPDIPYIACIVQHSVAKWLPVGRRMPFGLPKMYTQENVSTSEKSYQDWDRMNDSLRTSGTWRVQDVQGMIRFDLNAGMRGIFTDSMLPRYVKSIDEFGFLQIRSLKDDAVIGFETGVIDRIVENVLVSGVQRGPHF